MIGSLFSGIGGLELGLERAGLGPVVWQCEQDPYCRAVLARHWPDAVRYDDVRTLNGAALVRPTILCGGFPCQDISAANPNGRGLDGARSGLWFEYRRLVEELAPRGVVVENVGRLARRGLDVVAGGLADLGYEVEVTRILAADVGAPHLRERLFVVAVADAGGEAERMADAQGERGPEPRREQHGAGVAAAVGGRPGVADAHGEGQLQPGGSVGAERRRAPDRRDLDVCAGGVRRTAEPRVGGGPDGFPSGLDGPGPGGTWPAPRGASQHAWEAPRTLHGAVNRPARLRALGNAVVPQVAYAVGLRLRNRLEVSAGRAGPA